MIDVINPGVHPELSRLAAELAKRGILHKYRSAAGIPQGSLIHKVLEMAATVKITSGGTRRVSSRILPPEIHLDEFQAHAAFFELLFKGLHSAPIYIHEPLMRLRNEMFDRSVAKSMSADVSAVIVQATAGKRSLGRAQQFGARTILAHPLVHHRWMNELMEEEASSNPLWAASLQGLERRPQYIRFLDEELELSSQLLVLSTFARNTFIESGVSPEKIAVTSMGVDFQDFPLRKQGPTPSDPFRIVFAGQLTQRKGLSYLIDGFRQAVLPPGSELILAGHASVALPEVPRDSRVRFVGNLSRTELLELYQFSDLFLLPSLAEGFPSAPAQAMAVGVPVAVSTNTFGADVITSGLDGFVIAPRDSVAICDLLEWAAQNRNALLEMGLRGARRIREFTWTRYAEVILSRLSQV